MEGKESNSKVEPDGSIRPSAPGQFRHLGRLDFVLVRARLEQGSGYHLINSDHSTFKVIVHMTME
jgi:hypothetical protein